MQRADFLRLASILLSGLGCRPTTSKRDVKRLAVTSVPPGFGFAPAWDINGVIGTGQSLAVGAYGTPLRATQASLGNLKLDLGGYFSPAAEPDDPRLQLVPLCEPIRRLASHYPGAYPRNVFGETPHTAMASQITRLFLEKTAGAGDYVTSHSVVGESGQAMRVIAKGAAPSDDSGRAYAASLFEARVLARLARDAGRTFGVAAVVLTHGESDAESPTYGQELLTLARDYDSDLRRITGQSQPVLLLATQQSSCPSTPSALALSSLQLLAASESAPERIVCVGPKYQLPYIDDGVHLSALGYDQLGEKYGQVYFERVVCGRDWLPLAPRDVTRSGRVIEVEFHVPVPPLRWDAAFVTSPAARPEWDKGRGFELAGGDVPVVIEEVTLARTSAKIRYSGEPAGPLRLRYAQSAVRAKGPKACWRVGALCDSDPFVGVLTKLPQPNYAVMFERSVA
jgi:hypothetical protein